MIALPIGIAKFLSGVMDRIGKMVGGIGDWLRADHNWWRIGCFTLGVASLIQTFVLLDAKREIVLVQQTCAAQKETLAASAMTDLVTEQAATTACRVNLQAEVGRRQAVEQLAKQAIQHAGKTEAQADKELARWQERYDAKPKTCDDAIKALDQLCPAL